MLREALVMSGIIHCWTELLLRLECLGSKMPAFLVSLSILAWVTCMSWHAEILQERAEGCIQLHLQKKIYQHYVDL